MPLSHCDICKATTEHVTGKGTCLPGIGFVDMKGAGPHCIPCLTTAAKAVREASREESHSQTAPEDVVMPFGKYKGRTLGWIADNDLLYLDWLASAEIRGHRLQQAVWDICARRAHEIRSLLDAEA